MKVTLSTYERELEDIVLKEYPGTITAEQCKKVGGEDGRIYLFTDLDLKEAEDFLSHYRRFRYILYADNFRKVNIPIITN